jgi:hypothetical protein
MARVYTYFNYQDDTDFETEELLSSKTHIARKEHICSFCKRIIQPGEQYHRHVSVGDKFGMTKCCEGCEYGNE